MVGEVNMSPFVRRAVIGTIAGTIAAAPLISALGHIVGVLLLGALIGAGFAILTGPTPGAYLDSIFTAGAYGVPLWAVITVITLPLLSGQMPEWSAEQMRSHFPALVGWVLFGVTLGFCTQLLNDITTRWLGPEAAPQGQDPTPTKRIVILGGGFAGMKTAECLERELEKDRSVSISLVSETNALLFTPMLAEVAGSSLEPSHISTPLRTSLHRTEFVRGRVTGVDLESKRVSLDAGNGAETCQSELTYDHLVFALGAVSNYLGLSNVHLEDASITPWLVTAMFTPALGVLMLMAFSKAARENILWKINWRALAFAPFCILIPTLVAFAEIAIFSGKGWGGRHGSRFQPLAFKCRVDVGYWAGENKTGPCSLPTSS
jgi:hypothetical protein